MNAIEFIQQHGVEKAKKVLGNAGLLHKSYTPAGGLYHRYEMTGTVSLTELKRLVESVGLVGKVGGISQAKAQVKQAHEHGYQTMSIPVEINGSMGMGCLYIDTLEKAIADYESIGGEHV